MSDLSKICMESLKCIKCYKCGEMNKLEDMEGDRPGKVQCPHCFGSTYIPVNQWHGLFQKYQPELNL